MDVEDFSFPATTDSPPSSIGSPPLWRASSAPGSLPRQHQDTVVAVVGKRGDQQDGPRRGFDQGPVESEHGPGKGGSLSLDEEKMDILWEDFNEELSPPLPLPLQRNGKGSRKAVSAGCGSVKAWSISRANTEKPGVVALLKLLGKLFLFHGDHPPLKKGRTNSW